MSRYKKSIASLVDEELSSGNLLRLEVITSSMSPLIRSGDEIIIKKISLNSLLKGDVIAYRKYDDVFVHRALYRSSVDGKPALVTKGDRVLAVDPAVFENDLLGKVVKIKGKKKEINLDNTFWKIINFLVGIFFHCEALLYIFYRKIKKEPIKNGY